MAFARVCGVTTAFLGLLSTAALGQTPDLSAKPASAATIAAQAKERAALPKDNGKDAAFAAQGFVATRADPIIRNKDGKPVWNLAAYDWMKGEAPDGKSKPVATHEHPAQEWLVQTCRRDVASPGL